MSSRLFFARAVHALQSSHQPRRSTLIARSRSLSTPSASVRSTETITDQPLRRRRRRGSSTASLDNNITNQHIPDDVSTINNNNISSSSSSSTPFTPKDTNGNLLDAQEYLSLASLSPWVPCPDMVIKRIFEVAEAESSDVHADLGCGDGRVNFGAVDGACKVHKSWGVDIDHNILNKCHERLGRRYVPTTTSGRQLDETSASEATSLEADKLEFLQADLIRVIDRQKEKYQQQFTTISPTADNTNDNVEEEDVDWSKEDDVTQRLLQSTIITLYFVDEALKQIQPYLESTLGGKDNVRVITVGYEIKGWEATWVERVLGLTIFKYDMRNVTNEPVQWKVVREGEENENVDQNQQHTTTATSTLASSSDSILDDYSDVDESEELATLLQQKRQKDLEELNSGLRIHHDEALNDFTQSKAIRQAADSSHSTKLAEELEEWEREERGWDFDETEDPEELIMEAQRVIAEARKGARGGSGMKAGLGKIDNKRSSSKVAIASKKKPVWKKP